MVAWPIKTSQRYAVSESQDVYIGASTVDFEDFGMRRFPRLSYQPPVLGVSDVAPVRSPRPLPPRSPRKLPSPLPRPRPPRRLSPSPRPRPPRPPRSPPRPRNSPRNSPLPLPRPLPCLEPTTCSKPSFSAAAFSSAAMPSVTSSAQLLTPCVVAGVAVRPVSVSAGSRGTSTQPSP